MATTASATFNEMQTRLNTVLDDADNFTFTADEKEEALTQAWDDEYVWTDEYNETITTVSEQSNYSLPTGIEHIEEIMIDKENDGYPEPLDPSAYRIYGGKIYFNRNYKSLEGSKTLVLVGKKKLTTSDDLPTFLQNYVLALAQAYTTELLRNKRVNRFIKNDTTLGEILRAGQDAHRKALQMRRHLHSGRTARM